MSARSSVGPCFLLTQQLILFITMPTPGEPISDRRNLECRKWIGTPSPSPRSAKLLDTLLLMDPKRRSGSIPVQLWLLDGAPPAPGPKGYPAAIICIYRHPGLLEKKQENEHVYKTGDIFWAHGLFVLLHPSLSKSRPSREPPSVNEGAAGNVSTPNKKAKEVFIFHGNSSKSCFLACFLQHTLFSVPKRLESAAASLWLASLALLCAVKLRFVRTAARGDGGGVRLRWLRADASGGGRGDPLGELGGPEKGFCWCVWG